MKFIRSQILLIVSMLLMQISYSQTNPTLSESINQTLISKPLSGSKIIRTSKVKQFGAVEWTLSNNVKVVFKKVNYEKDNIILNAYSFGGTSLYNVDLLPSATMLPSIIETYGIGDFDNVTLQKILSGKKASAVINLGELTEGISGTSTSRDFETMMQLVYLRFEKPRFDRDAHDAIMTRYSTFLTNMARDPSKIMQDSVSLFLTNYSPRTMVMNNDFLRLVDFEKIRKIYSERFNNAADFTFFVVGDIDEDTVKPLIEKYIGSIQTKTEKENFFDWKVMPPEGKFVKEVQITMAVPMATVFISHNSTLKYNSYNNVTLKVIQGILDLTIKKKIREIEGGTYGVSLNFSSQIYPGQKAVDMIMFDCDTSKVDSLKAIIYNEINKLTTLGPDKKDLDKVISSLLHNREESRLHNSYWSNALYAFYFTGVDVNDTKNYEEILKKLSIDDVRKVAGFFFSKADVADIVFRPKSQ